MISSFPLIDRTPIRHEVSRYRLNDLLSYRGQQQVSPFGDFLPSTVAKLLSADVWVVLDDVQFNARDYQHRMRLSPFADPARQAWLTLPVHRPRGRASLIDELRLAEPAASARRLMQLPRQYYGSNPHWPEAAKLLEAVTPLVVPDGYLTDVSEASTRVILRALGSQGQIVCSSTFDVRTERSQRLADLTAVTSSSEYLCGPGGARYLDEKPFAELELTVRYASAPSTLTPERNRLSILGQIVAEGLVSSAGNLSTKSGE